MIFCIISQQKSLGSSNTESMALLLDEISKITPEGRYAAVVIDNAGYHHANDLPEYENLVLIPLPPYSPELNSSEQLWEWLREHDLSNRSFKNYDAIVDGTLQWMEEAYTNSAF